MKNLCVLLLCVLLTACPAEVTPSPVVPPTQTLPVPTTTSLPVATQTRKPKPIALITPVSTSTSTSTPGTPTPDPAEWKTWPVIPEKNDPSMQKVYERGLALGNDPHAFSIFGDCQARPAEFFGVFETDAILFESLAPELQETVDNFTGSFNRESSTAQDGTTPGSLLWAQWHRGEYGCSFAETPVECELRTHRPAFVIIQVGTHFESRNTE
jgi:hypothetical protein